MTETQFFCVYTFNRMLTDYECVGVFTKRDDAEAFAAEKAQSPIYEKQTFPVITRTFREVIDAEIKMRLGRMADILFTKEQGELDARQSAATESGGSYDFTSRDIHPKYAELYGREGIAVDVAEKSPAT